MSETLKDFTNFIEKIKMEGISILMVRRMVEYLPFFKEIMANAEYLEEAINILITKKNGEFYKLLDVLVTSYFEINKNKAKKFFRKKLKQLDYERYERVIIESALFSYEYLMKK